MNLLQKLYALKQPNPLSSKPGFDAAYALARALGLRRSRLGVTTALKKRLRNVHARVMIDRAPLKADMAYRIGDYGDLLALNEVFVGSIYDFSKVRVPPKTIVDVGGHIGSFSIAAHHHFPAAPITVFEPTAASYALLTRNLARNGVAAIAHQKAASNMIGQLRMGGPTAIGATLGPEGEETVEVVRLSDHIDFASAGPLLLKIDVEGAEWDIFDDILGKLPRDIFLFIEVHEGGSAIYRLKHSLEPLGFRVHAPESGSAKGLAIDCYATRGVYSGA